MSRAQRSADPRRNIVKLLEGASRRHDRWTVFSDAMEMMALAISNRFDLHEYERREARYLEIAKRYNADELQACAQVLAEITMGLEAGHDDLLGACFGEMDMGNSARGQFFTPYALSLLLAQATFDDTADQIIAEEGFVTVLEPAVGAGGMVIAAADVLTQRGHTPLYHMHATCIDVDARAVHMCYVQLSLLAIPAVVIRGNALHLTESEHWYTPAHYLGGWPMRLRRRESRAAAPVPAQLPAPAPSPAVQLPLFAEAS